MFRLPSSLTKVLAMAFGIGPLLPSKSGSGYYDEEPKMVPSSDDESVSSIPSSSGTTASATGYHKWSTKRGNNKTRSTSHLKAATHHTYKPMWKLHHVIGPGRDETYCNHAGRVRYNKRKHDERRKEKARRHERAGYCAVQAGLSKVKSFVINIIKYFINNHGTSFVNYDKMPDALHSSKPASNLQFPFCHCNKWIKKYDS